MNIIEGLKRELNLKDIPLIIGELGDNYPSGKFPYSKELNKVLHKIAADIPNCAIVSSQGLTFQSDGVHFDSVSLREFGKRYFIEYKRILI